MGKALWKGQVGFGVIKNNIKWHKIELKRLKYSQKVEEDGKMVEYEY